MGPARSYRYFVVDVFTEVQFRGNPLAVFPEAKDLSSDEMQALARELNLSESSFVFAPRDARSAARVRIFTPWKELDFAGHPTIGTAFALVTLGRIPPADTAFVLEENIGPVPIRLERRAGPFLAWLSTPPITLGAIVDRARSAAALGLETAALLGEYPVQLAGAGNPFLYVPLRDAAAVDRAALDARALAGLVPANALNGVFLFAPAPNGVYARMFAPMSGITEDPATGSATGPLGAYLVEHGLIERRDGLSFVNEQGTAMGRQSFIHAKLRVREGNLETVEVGGSAVTVMEGNVTLTAS